MTVIVWPAPPPAPSALALSLSRMTRNYTEAARTIGRALLPGLAAAAQQLAKFARQISAWANDPVRVAGLEGRYTVRAGLDPAYATPEARDQLIAGILAGSEPETLMLTRANRIVVAVAAMHGWAHGWGRRELVETVVYYRLIGSTKVSVVIPRSAA